MHDHTYVHTGNIKTLDYGTSIPETAVSAGWDMHGYLLHGNSSIQHIN